MRLRHEENERLMRSSMGKFGKEEMLSDQTSAQKSQ